MCAVASSHPQRVLIPALWGVLQLPAGCNRPRCRHLSLQQISPPSDAATAAAGAPRWRRAACLPLAPLQQEGSLTFETPLLASAVMFEFTELHSSLHAASGEVLTCPRCSQVVTDAHGVCRACRENAYQCRQCRAISYDAPQGTFLCSECGYSRRGRVCWEGVMAGFVRAGIQACGCRGLLLPACDTALAPWLCPVWSLLPDCAVKP
jgi:hypothetical protein